MIAPEASLRPTCEPGRITPRWHWMQTIRLIPPLNVIWAQVDEGLGIFREAVLAG